MTITRQLSSFAVEEFIPPTYVRRQLSSFGVVVNKFRRQLSSFKVSTAYRTRQLSSYKSWAAKRRINESRYRGFTKDRRAIYATNQATQVLTFLGYVTGTAGTLTDVALADGFYTIEVRSSGNYWTEARARITFDVEIDGGVVVSSGIPNIINLRAERGLDFQTVLKWSSTYTADVADLNFAIFESATPSIDVSGVPDYILPALREVGTYQLKPDPQTGDLYYAVVAYRPSELGNGSEIFSPWSTTPPVSPQSQNIYN